MTSDATKPTFRLNPWLLRFHDSKTEQAFNRSWIKGTSRITRIWAAAGLLFYVAYTILVLTTIPTEAQGPIWIRLAIILPIIALAQLPMFWAAKAMRGGVRAGGQHLTTILAASYVITSGAAYSGALLMFATTAAPYNQVYLYEVGVVFIFCQHYIRIRFALVALFTLFSTLASGTVFLLVPGLALGPVDASLMTVLAFAAVGLFSAYTREIFVRRNYASIQILRAEKERSEQLAAAARDASQAKSRFLAMMSHELRTPLNAIIGFSDAMHSGVFGRVEQPQYREYLCDINRSGGQLLYLVNQILDLTRAEEQQVEMIDQSNCLAELVDSVGRSFELPMKDAGIEFCVENQLSGKHLLADQRMLRQMLDNLLSNAMKFTRCGGRVSLLVESMSGGGVAIRVADTGIGMSADDAKRALSLFDRVDNELNRGYDGAGIGLPLTSKLVKLHDGRLELGSAPGRGTTITLVFPAKRVAVVEARATGTAVAAPVKTAVLSA